MQQIRTKAACGLVLLAALVGAGASAEPAPGTLRIAGIAFVDSSVTGMGSRAKLPAGAKVLSLGTVSGTEGCPTNRYNTDGMIVAVIDYDGPPTSASLAITAHPANGGSFDRAPYYLDLNPGRTLQFLGPIFDNGVYDLKVEWGFAGPSRSTTTGSFSLKRSCPQPR